MMSAFCVELVNKETIKPSSPTPPHLKTFKQSIIDQHEPFVAIPLLLLFPACSSIAPCTSIERLKKSLPDTLTRFYPLAGRVSDNQYVECNDEGIHLFETRVNAPMTRVLKHRIPEEMVELLPKGNFSGPGPKVVLCIQINIFDCGGMALGFCISHRVADASSFMLFINSWAADTKGSIAETNTSPLSFGMAHLFPPKDTGTAPIMTPPLDTHVKLVSKRFIFSASNIAALRAKCANNSYTPTRVEAVTTFIWSCAMKAAKLDSSVLMSGLNLRTRMDPPLTSSSFGNIMLGLLMTSTTKGDRPPDGLECLADKLHQAIRKINGSYVKELQADHRVMALYGSYKEVFDELSSKGGVSFFVITSFCRFPLYEADFGWGKPEWAAFVDCDVENMTYLTDTKCGTGIEAWITMSEELMNEFVCNPDLIAFTSLI